jgi:hypothetical protein
MAAATPHTDPGHPRPGYGSTGARAHLSKPSGPSTNPGALRFQTIPGSACALCFHPGPPGRSFFTSWPGTHAHCHIYLIHVCLCYSRQILFTLGIWSFHVQVLAQHLPTFLLQVYTQRWHVVSPTVLHSHSSHTLCFLPLGYPFPA